MKVYIITRRFLMVMGFGILLCCGIVYFGQSMIATEEVIIASDVSGSPIYQGNTGEKAVSITVNVDWGEEFIPAMLEAFKKNDAEVTFFVTGKWAEKNQELLKRMKDAGHSIQNHGYKHLHFNQLGADEVGQQIKMADEIIKEATGEKTSYFASPYGEHNDNLVKTVTGMEYRFIMWSVDTIDWQRPSPEVIVDRVMKRVHNDAIILMHPTDPTVKALPELLKQLKAENYQMVSIEKIIMEKTENK
ncbi:MAG: polysaccharide deacetylase family protein [Bacillota bacterium]|nr:polysaccharide deacetylase family protein [Bacillota bacterium]